MLDNFCKPGKIDFVIGGQFGSCGKGAASAWLTVNLGRRYNIVTTNAGCQSGHTSIVDGKKCVLFHFPTAGVIDLDTFIYLNAGSVLDPYVLRQEFIENNIGLNRFCIHPNAAIVTPECREAESRADSAQTRIASTRKGVGEAISRKVLRSAKLARDYDWGKHGYVPNVARIDLNKRLQDGSSVLCEIPQGVSLSLNSQFYPHVTSRDCTVMQAMSDAGVHPSFMGSTMLVMRTFPIRVGNIVDLSYAPHDGVLGQSGGCYPGQRETSWEALGVEPEITTVTKRVRRVFTWSQQQLHDAMALCRPELVYLTFCDYPANVLKLEADIREAAHIFGLNQPKIFYQYGPSTADTQDTPR